VILLVDEEDPEVDEVVLSVLSALC